MIRRIALKSFEIGTACVLVAALAAVIEAGACHVWSNR
jgi:hypothetical protein